MALVGTAAFLDVHWSSGTGRLLFASPKTSLLRTSPIPSAPVHRTCAPALMALVAPCSPCSMSSTLCGLFGKSGEGRMSSEMRNDITLLVMGWPQTGWGL